MEAPRSFLGLRYGMLALPLTLLLFYVDTVTAQPPAFGTHSSRADFRPLSRADDKTLEQSRRPRPVGGQLGAIDRRARFPDVTGGRAGVRKAVPVTRGQELGSRFRPDEREPVQGIYSGAVPGSAAIGDMQQQFRPIAPRRKPTYEEFEAQRRSTAPAAPAAPLGYAPVQPPFGPAWR